MLVHINKKACLRRGFLIEILPYFNTASWDSQLYLKKTSNLEARGVN